MAKDDGGEKHVRLVLSGPTHDRLRVAAAQARMSMAAYCAVAVEKAVNADVPPKPAKKER